MNRRKFLAGAVAAVVSPALPAVTPDKSYAFCTGPEWVPLTPDMFRGFEVGRWEGFRFVSHKNNGNL